MSQGAFIAPARGIQSAIAGIWQDVLELQRVGAQDDFFELGGDSLAAVHMLAMIDEVLLVQISFADFLEAPTVAGLAELVERERRAPNGAPPGGGAAGDGPAALDAPTAGGDVPCTYAQERLWFLEQLGGSSAAYNMPLGARLRGPLDVDALSRALQEIVNRHEALRTSFFTAPDGRPAQAASAASFDLDVFDLRTHSDPEVEAARLVDELVSLPLPLDRAPLMRAVLVRLTEDEHVLELVFHHIVCDGASQVVVWRELGALYDAYTRGETATLSPPRVQYLEHARGVRASLAGDVLQATVDPWLERLAGCPAALELATDRPRPAVPTYHGATHRLRLAASTAAGVRRFARSRSGQHRSRRCWPPTTFSCTATAARTTSLSVRPPRGATLPSSRMAWACSRARWRCAATSAASRPSTELVAQRARNGALGDRPRAGAVRADRGAAAARARPRAAIPFSRSSSRTCRWLRSRSRLRSPSRTTLGHRRPASTSRCSSRRSPATSSSWPGNTAPTCSTAPPSSGWRRQYVALLESALVQPDSSIETLSERKPPLADIPDADTEVPSAGRRCGPTTWPACTSVLSSGSLRRRRASR